MLRTYLGAAPGREVLAGQIRRGDVRRLEAVVMLTDLRGFTAMTASASEAELLATLDDYFEVVADAVQSQGGEVLKFIGDGVLSVFPVEAGRLADRAGAAVAAARAAQTAGGAPFTAVLSSGPVAYGNIGARERLDFTVIGPAVNLASRIEAVASGWASPWSPPPPSRRQPASPAAASAAMSCGGWRKWSSWSPPRRMLRPAPSEHRDARHEGAGRQGPSLRTNTSEALLSFGTRLSASESIQSSDRSPTVPGCR